VRSHRAWRQAHREHAREHRRRHERRRDEWHAEKEMWHKAPHRARWLPWWLQSRMRWRIFTGMTLAVAAGGLLGYHLESHPRWWQIGVALIVLSAASGAIAWRITRPLIMVIGAARDIGDGKLELALDAGSHGGEVRVLASAINDMAAKIRQQLADQRQLLAAVSHELRTPLGHMRVLVETARDAGAAGGAKALDELEREILVLDDLVGRLLASSRLEFGNLDRRPLDLGELVTDVATSAGVPPEAIEAIGAIGDVRAAVDPTLVRRAIANLLDNARVHGGGAVAVRIERRGARIAIEVDDAGPGVPADRRADAFRAFVPSAGGGLGLGLALVSRIAVAHGGGAWIDDRPGGGARVGFGVEALPEV
jgi:two-component system OmpR family sensor kinase